MHPYATDSNERIVIPVLLGAGAALAALGLSKVVSASGLQEQLWWLDMPAVWGFYVLFVKVFDRALWNLRVLRMIRLVKVPDLAGAWRGHGVSSYRDERGKPKRFEVEVVIRQRWTKCAIHLETSTSYSDSTIGAVLIGDGDRPTLSYEYRNQPRAHAEETMHAHPGMTRLERVDATHLEGEYYTGRDRREYGTLHLTRQS